MKIEKKFTIAAPLEKVWSILTKPQLIAQCIPGCESVEEVSYDKFKAAVHIQVGPIKTVFDVDIVEIEREQPNYAVYETSGDEGGRASHVKAVSKFALVAIDDNTTEVVVTSDFKIIGRLGKFGTGMMNKIIDTMSADTFNAIAGYIERGELPSKKSGPGKLTIIFWGVVVLAAVGVAALLL